ncbi:MAG: cytochrome o ubiquinol oxidase subunit III [Gammaproteobacteria bacterium]|jgi:cytochrome o ubiquinol oxidase subunit 3
MSIETSIVEELHKAEVQHTDAAAREAFGFWIYLMTDLVLFATLFATFAVLQHHYAGGPTGRDLFNLTYTFAETMFLLFSSASYGLVTLAVQSGKTRWVVAWLVVTILLGLGFITMEIKEFHGMIVSGDGPWRSAFLSAFFTLVGTHGTHVTFGLIWMAVMIWQVAIKGLTVPVQSRLLRLGMFWHFLDIVWIGVFTVVYLLGVM